MTFRQSDALVGRWHRGAALLWLLLLAGLIRAQAFVTTVSLNPDEAELLAEGRRAAVDLLPPYGGYTSTTHAFLWPATLGVLHRLGMPLTLTSAHVLSAFGYVLMLWLVFLGLCSRLGRAVALAVVTVVAVGVMTGPADLISLHTELLPELLLIAGAIAGLMAPTSSRARSAAGER